MLDRLLKYEYDVKFILWIIGMTPQDWKDRGAFKEVLGRRLFAASHAGGHAQSILLVHGFPTFSYDWAPIWDDLAAGYNLYAPDMLAFGFSEKPYPHTYSIHEQADLVAEYARLSGIKNCHVLAHDYGDTVVQELMARQNAGDLPFQMDSVCLLNGGLFPETHQALLIQKLLLSPLGPLVNKLTNKSRFDKSFSRVFGPETKPSETQLAEFWDVINSGGGRHMFHSLITYMRDRRENRERWINAIGDFTGPVALINGSYDPVSGAHMVARFKELLGEPHFLREYKAIGHYPQLEAPERVAADYLEFLAGAYSFPTG